MACCYFSEHPDCAGSICTSARADGSTDRCTGQLDSGWASGKRKDHPASAHALSEKGRRVAVVDERCELFPCTSRGFALPVPNHCDVLSDMPKAEGILSAVRSLGPQDVLCDELGGVEDMAAVRQGLGCGVCFVASIHGETKEDLQLRCGALLGKGGFAHAVFLRGNQAPGQIAEVMALT